MPDDYRAEIREALQAIYQAEEEHGYNAIDQMVGFLLSGDETYITNHNDARRIARKYDRDDFMYELLETYFQ